MNDDFHNCIRLSVAYYEHDELVEGVKGLCRSVETVIKRQNNGM